MAQDVNEFPVVEVHGAVEKGGSINRMKTFKDSEGHVIAHGPQERYTRQPRDYRKHPTTANEARQQNLMAEASRRSKIEREDPAKLAQWQARFNEQLQHATSDTPDKLVNGKRQIYKRLDAFITAKIHEQLKAGLADS